MKNCCCDLCGSENYLSFPKGISSPQRVVICRVCGLIYTNPCWDEAEIRQVYDHVFRDDPGAPLNAQKDNAAGYRAERFERAQSFINDFMIPLLCQHVDPLGKKWLDVRFRAGALPVRLAELGADVRGVDIFAANVDWLQTKLPEALIYRSDVYNLLESASADLDVISMVTTHVPSHVPSPTKLFETAFKKLVVGGILFVDEKDVTQIAHKNSLFPFQYPFGMAHYHHLTLRTTEALIKKAGFEILFADYIERVTAQKHFLIVAKKTLEKTPNQTITFPAEVNPVKVYAHLLRQYLKIRLRQKGRAILKKVKKRF